MVETTPSPVWVILAREMGEGLEVIVAVEVMVLHFVQGIATFGCFHTKHRQRIAPMAGPAAAHITPHTASVVEVVEAAQIHSPVTAKVTAIRSATLVPMPAPVLSVVVATMTVARIASWQHVVVGSSSRHIWWVADEEVIDQMLRTECHGSTLPRPVSHAAPDC